LPDNLQILPRQPDNPYKSATIGAQLGGESVSFIPSLPEIIRMRTPPARWDCDLG
jgi:hypothetical protein